jgi:hypothetical protein
VSMCSANVALQGRQAARRLVPHCWVNFRDGAEMSMPLHSAGRMGETSGQLESTANGDIVTRRLLVGALVTGVTVAFALVPTESLDGHTKKPLSFYLVPVLRSLVRTLSAPMVGTCDVVSGVATYSCVPHSCYHCPSHASHPPLQRAPGFLKTRGACRHCWMI